MENCTGQTSDKVVRQKKYGEFQSLLMEDFPTIFLWQPKYTYLIDKKVRGLEISTLLTPSDRWENIMAGYINTKRTLKYDTSIGGGIAARIGHRYTVAS